VVVKDEGRAVSRLLFISAAESPNFAGKTRRLQQGPGEQPCESVQMGLTADVCRRGFPHQFQGDEEAGNQAIHCWSAGEVVIAAITLGLVLDASKLVKL
jgi:hypothetical protein